MRRSIRTLPGGRVRRGVSHARASFALPLALVLGLSAASTAAAQEADAVVDEVLAAYGGTDVLAGTEAMRLEGTIITHPGEAHGSLIRISEGRDALKVLLHYPHRVEIRIVDGEEGYNGSSPGNLSPASGPMLAAMQLQAARSWVPWIMDYLRDGLEIERSSPDLVVLVGDLGPGLRLRFFVEGASHHVLRTESVMSMASMSMVFATDYGDFREVDGIMVPFREESFASGTHTASLVVNEAIRNPPADQRRLPTGMREAQPATGPGALPSPGAFPHPSESRFSGSAYRGHTVSHIPPFKPDRRLFPFESKWYESPVGRVHYVDEGEGEPILFLHGNPTWSFLYRGIIIRLRKHHRCIAMDYPGFGLSAHPDDYGYTPAEHAEVVGSFVRHLGLRNLTLMGHDWGGPIGMRVAVDELPRLRALVMGNTWYWPPDAWQLKAFSYVLGSAPMQTQLVRRNFFVDKIMPLGVKYPLADEVMDHYREPFPTAASRVGVAELPRQILDSGLWLGHLADEVADRLANVPLLLLWGIEDLAFPRQFMQRFREDFRLATVRRLDAKHFIQEDQPGEIAEAIEEFLAGVGAPA